MNNSGIHNPMIRKAIADLRHTESFSIVDVGTPVPIDANLIDISLIADIPSFLDTLKAVMKEVVVEKYVVAEEIDGNPAVLQGIQHIMGEIPAQFVSHEDLKRLIACSKTILRTGECSPYANIILIGGVNF